ncbi:DnaJ domain containing protein [Sesbania bispinosa]|nr:DnaJ domain containing protein [Sesbania bispinosa]
MGSREFAILAQETEPLLEGSDQILAIVDVLLASEKRVNNHPDWYRRLALLLHPDKSRFHFADHAFKLVADAWAILSDPIKKSHYDKDLSFFSVSIIRPWLGPAG